MRVACAVLSLLAVGSAASAPRHEMAFVQTSEQTGTGMTSQARAAAWMWIRLHAWDKQPQPDELAELKSADPNSYAIVSALLAKQQLGVLNPRHPRPFMPRLAALSTTGRTSSPRMPTTRSWRASA